VVLRGQTIVQANACFAAYLKMAVGDLIGRSFADLRAEAAPEPLRPGAALQRVWLRGAGERRVIASLRVSRLGAETEGGAPPLLLVTARDVTGQVEAEGWLRDAEEQYRQIFENAQEGIYQTTPGGGYLKVNPALARIYGYDSPEDLIAGLTDIASQLYVDPACRTAFARIMEADGKVRDFEAEIRRRDGEIIWITENARCVRDVEGRVRYYEGTVTDITARKQAETEIRLLAKVFDSAAEGIVLLDEAGVVRAVNRAYGQITGFREADLLGASLDLVADGLHESVFLEGILREVAETGYWQGEVFCARAQGTVPGTGDGQAEATAFPAEVTATAVRDEAGRLTHTVLTLEDITRRKRDEEFIRFHANYDTLTRLPNRRLVLERLTRTLEHVKRTGGRGCLLFLDLDRFKQINDNFGHAAGDELLKLVAQRLRHCVRTSDTVGRLSGDEFVILLPEVGPGRAGAYTAEKVLYSLSEPFTLMGSEQFCIPSIGITYFPDQGTEVEVLLRNADVAMYHAKRGGELRYCGYEPWMNESSMGLLSLETDLRLAAARGELELHYQPKVRAGGLALVGAEALVRWRHPTLGLISPAQFIPLAEETGLIIGLGRWVLQTACRQVKQWRDGGLTLPSVSVNVSARQFAEPDFVEVVGQTLADTGLPADVLDLEITETVMSGDVERAVRTLQSLKEMGVTLSMDDFGTGYSSLNYLKAFPIDTLKIDQTFIRGVMSSDKDAAIVSTIIALARNLGFATVAEGVETAAQAAFLAGSGCDLLQGYHIGRPMPAGVFADFIHRCQAAAE
jgi:diguanylate cyclase (GGDEF)-like protein/PAS domain S-box-containing protein